MRNLKFALFSFLALALFVTSTASATIHETKSKTELVTVHYSDFHFVGTTLIAPQIPFAEICKATVLPGVELWNFSQPKFAIVNPVKLCEDDVWRNSMQVESNSDNLSNALSHPDKSIKENPNRIRLL